MDQKIGVYIDTGYGIGEALDIEALAKVATGEFKVARLQDRSLLERSGQTRDHPERHCRGRTYCGHHSRALSQSVSTGFRVSTA